MVESDAVTCEGQKFEKINSMTGFKMKIVVFGLAALLACPGGAAGLRAQAPATVAPATQAAAVPTKPTLQDVPYGGHERQVLDFWKAESPEPTPAVFFIHGGGWMAGDKARVQGLEAYLEAGISVVSINYRFIQHALEAGVNPPVQWPLADAARALQFVRSKAQAWNLDKERIGASGGSAGACSSLWLAFHDDLADPQSSDPVARESTRLWCAAVTGAQTTLDPRQMQRWTPNSRYGGHAFGFWPDPKVIGTRDTQFAQFLEARDELLPWIRKYSPIEHVTADDPPVYLAYSDPPAPGQPQRDPTHSANFGVMLQERLREVGLQAMLVYPGAPFETSAAGPSDSFWDRHPPVHEYLIKQLTSR